MNIVTSGWVQVCQHVFLPMLDSHWYMLMCWLGFLLDPLSFCCLTTHRGLRTASWAVSRVAPGGADDWAQSVFAADLEQLPATQNTSTRFSGLLQAMKSGGKFENMIILDNSRLYTSLPPQSPPLYLCIWGVGSNAAIWKAHCSNLLANVICER